jgi:hypothetical protein
MIQEIWLIVTLSAMLILPGWAMLAISRVWRHWATLQRWVLAISLSIAFYPILFYGLHFFAPFLTLGPYKMSALLLLCAAVILWKLRGHYHEQLDLDQKEWVALGIFSVTLFTRIWIIQDHPYPAWSDSLHHTLLTQLTAIQGGLPSDMEPYFPVHLDQYHLGLYSLTSSVQWLAQVPAHTALLWTAQVLNGLCVMGVYLVLDRKVGRIGAIVGAATVGLLSHQPAFYVNWGRFTQVSSQAILLAAWIMAWDAMSLWQRPWREYRAQILWTSAFASALIAAVFLLHFRVAAFLLPLLALSAIFELWRARKHHRIARMMLGTVAIGALSLLLILPALWEALAMYVHVTLGPTLLSDEEVAQSAAIYYSGAWQTSYLVAPTWLLVLSGASAIAGLLRRNKLVIICLLWTLALYLIGSAHVLGILLLNITNLGAVLIMLYLPIGLTVGAAAEELFSMLGSRLGLRVKRLILSSAVIALIVALQARISQLEPYRFFVTPEDLQAMAWIEENTPADAIFAVNTYFWLPGHPHGTDAGYWIPYLTGRQMTASVMLLSLGTAEYKSRVVKISQIVERLETDSTALDELYAHGVDYVYIGQRGDVAGPGLDPLLLACAERAGLVYRDAGIFIFKILPPLLQ